MFSALLVMYMMGFAGVLFSMVAVVLAFEVKGITAIWLPTVCAFAWPFLSIIMLVCWIKERKVLTLGYKRIQ